MRQRVPRRREGVGAPLANISGDSYDAMITARANASKSFGQKFFLRWGHEMNGNWYPWDGSHNGANATGSTWRTFSAMFGSIYSGLAAQGKPIIIPETASAEQGGDKAAWIAAILPALESSFPAIKALVWFQMNKETDWRADSSSAALSAFVRIGKDPT